MRFYYMSQERIMRFLGPFKYLKPMIIFSDNADPYKGQGRVRICKVCGKESNKGPH